MKRKWLAVGIILLFVGITCAPATAQNTERPLATSKGNWLYVGGSGPGNYTKIQDAIDDASDGDTIIVYSGTYYEAITLNKQLFLKGAKLDGQDFPLINGGDDYDTVTINNDSCCFENFSVQNGPAGGLEKGIHVLSNYNIIRNCSIFNTGSGIYLSHSCGNFIYNNVITGWGSRSIGLISSCNNSIFNNDLSGHSNHEIWFRDNSINNRFYHNNVHQCTHSPAILIEQSPFNIIEENNISNNYEGLVIRSSPNTSVLRNSFWGNGILFSASFQELCSYIIEDNLVDGKPLRYYVNQKGLTVPSDTGQVILINCSNFNIRNFTFIGAEHGIVLFFSSNNSITDNMISAGPAGILLSQSHDNVLSRNIINGGRGGIILGSSNRNIISNNTVTNQSKLPGILLKYSEDNEIVDNTVINCDIGIAPLHNSDNNEFIRNTVTVSTNGIFLFGSQYNYLYRNKISDCSLGVLVDGTNGDIFDTNFISNCGAGITLKYGKSTEIMHNVILENDNGIGLLECSDISIVKNNFSNNEEGVTISSSGFVSVKENNFIQNILDVSFSVRLLQVFTNKFNGNYWGNLSLNRHIIIGSVTIVLFAVYYHEISFTLKWVCIDWHPAQEPYDIPGVS